MFRSFIKIAKQNAYFRKFCKHNYKRCLAACISNSCARNVATQLFFVFIGKSTVKCEAAIAEQKEPKLMEAVQKTQPNESNVEVKPVFEVEDQAHEYLSDLKSRWKNLQRTPGVFAYRLKVRQARFIEGAYQFYTELNSDRMTNRRMPQTIETLTPDFKPSMFNFNKVNHQEVIMTIEHESGETQLIVNRSPITKYHTLVCPEAKSNLVQRITLKSLQFCVSFMRGIKDNNIRIGYNSPGALASVNHLHYHIVEMPQDLYIDKAELQEIAGGYIYRLSNEMPTEAICFEIKSSDNIEKMNNKLANIHELTEWMCRNNIPHNLFITRDRKHATDNVKIFIFARDTYCVNKDLTVFNVGFCELAGFIPLGDESKMQQLTEKQIVQRIRNVTGNVYETVYDKAKTIARVQSFKEQWFF